ncbi:MAG: basic amino acid ABC transporter substrate-binding protein [Fusobacteriaceae bacterium]
MKKLSLIICFALSMLFVGCGKKNEVPKDTNAEKVATKKVFYVGTNAEYAPFEYLENDKIVGFDIDLLEKIAEKVGFELKWSNTSFDGLIPALQSEKLDIVIAAMTVTEDRKKAINFSNPYQESPATFLTTVDSTFTDIKDAKGKKYGVQLGTTQEIIANTIENAEVVPYNSASIAVLDLKSKKVDCVLVDKSVADKFVKANPEIKIIGYLNGDSKAIAFRKTFDKDVIEKINKALEELKNDGTLAALEKKYNI